MEVESLRLIREEHSLIKGLNFSFGDLVDNLELLLLLVESVLVGLDLTVHTRCVLRELDIFLSKKGMN